MKSVYRILMFRPAEAFVDVSVLGASRRFDTRAFHIALLLVMVAILNAVDLSCTLFAHRIGLLEEMNPVANSFLAQGLEPSFISYKILMVLAGSMMLWRVRSSGWAIPACWIMIGTYTALTITWCIWVKDTCGLFECSQYWFR